MLRALRERRYAASVDFASGDRAAFRAAIGRLAQSAAPERAALAARARAFAAATFDPQRHVREHLELFARLTAPPG